MESLLLLLSPCRRRRLLKRALKPRRSSFVSYLKTFPGGEFERNHLAVAGCRSLTAYLLDTNVVSLLSPSRAGTAAGLIVLAGQG
jgi:hypothetical protein